MLTFWLQVRRIIKIFISILKDDDSRGLLILTALTLFSGTMFYTKVEGWPWLDALYFSFTTLTTIGYGDLAPATVIGKIFTMLYALLGLGVMVAFISVVIRHFLNSRTKE